MKLNHKIMVLMCILSMTSNYPSYV